MIIRIATLAGIGLIGAWLVLWDFIDWLTQGLNFGVWDNAILVNGFPSIAVGITIIIICTALGVSVIRG